MMFTVKIRQYCNKMSREHKNKAQNGNFNHIIMIFEIMVGIDTRKSIGN